MEIIDAEWIRGFIIRLNYPMIEMLNKRKLHTSTIAGGYRAVEMACWPVMWRRIWMPETSGIFF